MARCSRLFRAGLISSHLRHIFFTFFVLTAILQVFPFKTSSFRLFSSPLSRVQAYKSATEQDRAPEWSLFDDGIIDSSSVRQIHQALTNTTVDSIKEEISRQIGHVPNATSSIWRQAGEVVVSPVSEISRYCGELSEILENQIINNSTSKEIDELIDCVLDEGAKWMKDSTGRIYEDVRSCEAALKSLQTKFYESIVETQQASSTMNGSGSIVEGQQTTSATNKSGKSLDLHIKQKLKLENMTVTSEGPRKSIWLQAFEDYMAQGQNKANISTIFELKDLYISFRSQKSLLDDLVKEKLSHRESIEGSLRMLLCCVLQKSNWTSSVHRLHKEAMSCLDSIRMTTLDAKISGMAGDQIEDVLSDIKKHLMKHKMFFLDQALADI